MARHFCMALRSRPLLARRCSSRAERCGKEYAAASDCRNLAVRPRRNQARQRANFLRAATALPALGTLASALLYPRSDKCGVPTARLTEVLEDGGRITKLRLICRPRSSKSQPKCKSPVAGPPGPGKSMQ